MRERGLGESKRGGAWERARGLGESERGLSEREGFG